MYSVKMDIDKSSQKSLIRDVLQLNGVNFDRDHLMSTLFFTMTLIQHILSKPTCMCCGGGFLRLFIKDTFVANLFQTFSFKP